MRVRQLVRALVEEAGRDRVMGLAGEAAFFAVLSIFPGLLLAVSLLGVLDVILGEDLAAMVQQHVVSSLDVILTDAASGAVGSVEELFERARGDLFTLGVVGALVTLSGAFAVVINALNIAHDEAERRSWIRRRLLGLLLGVATMGVIVITLAAVVIGPLLGLGRLLADMAGVRGTFAFAWEVLRFPFLFTGGLLWLTVLLHYAPSTRARWREALPGALLTAVLWALATAGFHLYLRMAAGASPVIGAFGGGAIVMTWVYLLSLALLLGGELNAILRAGRAGTPGRASDDRAMAVSLRFRRGRDADARSGQARPGGDASPRSTARGGSEGGIGMAVHHSAGNLYRLSDTSLTVADPEADVRGRQALDSDGEEIGTVDDLLVDDEEHKVRFLRVAQGGFLGLGRQHFLVPVDAVASVEVDRIHIDRDRARLADVPAYDPDLADDPAYYAGMYGWWGYAPYWGADSSYPRSPNLR